MLLRDGAHTERDLHEFWRRIAPAAAPGELRPFRSMSGWDDREVPATPRDLWLWFHGEHYDENFAAALAAHAARSEPMVAIY